MTAEFSSVSLGTGARRRYSTPAFVVYSLLGKPCGFGFCRRDVHRCNIYTTDDNRKPPPKKRTAVQHGDARDGVEGRGARQGELGVALQDPLDLLSDAFSVMVFDGLIGGGWVGDGKNKQKQKADQKKETRTAQAKATQLKYLVNQVKSFRPTHRRLPPG